MLGRIDQVRDFVGQYDFDSLQYTEKKQTWIKEEKPAVKTDLK